jgi:hypothetical protein
MVESHTKTDSAHDTNLKLIDKMVEEMKVKSRPSSVSDIAEEKEDTAGLASIIQTNLE